MNNFTRALVPCDVCGGPFLHGTLSASRDMASGAVWRWTHDRCAPEHAIYVIDSTYLQNEVDALRWTWHLGEKTWFSLETWAAAMRALFPATASV